MSKRELPVIQAKPKKTKYDCSQCPAYCCAYDWIAVTRHDTRRLSIKFKLTFDQAQERFTKIIAGYGRVLRHRKDRIYGTACKFLDAETRRCTVYEHRPNVCREFPYNNSCHHYDYLIAERKHQDDPEAVPFGAVR